MALAAVHHPAHHRERLRRLAGVDRIGEIPRRDVAGLAEERLDVAGGEAHAFAERRVQHGDDAVEAAHVVAELLGDPRRRAGVEAHAVQLGLAPHPRRAVARLARRVGVGDVPAGRDTRRPASSGAARRRRPARAGSCRAGRRGSPSSGPSSSAVKRPMSRATTIRRSVRNGIVWAASTTERSSYSSPSNSSTSRLRSSSPTRWATRSWALLRRIDSSSPVSRWTPMAARFLPAVAAGDRT